DVAASETFADLAARQHTCELHAIANPEPRDQLFERTTTRAVANDGQKHVGCRFRHSRERLKAVLESLLLDEPADHDHLDSRRIASAERPRRPVRKDTAAHSAAARRRRRLDAGRATVSPRTRRFDKREESPPGTSPRSEAAWSKTFD